MKNKFSALFLFCLMSASSLKADIYEAQIKEYEATIADVRENYSETFLKMHRSAVVQHFVIKHADLTKALEWLLASNLQIQSNILALQSRLQSLESSWDKTSKEKNAYDVLSQLLNEYQFYLKSLSYEARQFEIYTTEIQEVLSAEATLCLDDKLEQLQALFNPAALMPAPQLTLDSIKGGQFEFHFLSAGTDEDVKLTAEREYEGDDIQRGIFTGLYTVARVLGISEGTASAIASVLTSIIYFIPDLINSLERRSEFGKLINRVKTLQAEMTQRMPGQEASNKNIVEVCQEMRTKFESNYAYYQAGNDHIRKVMAANHDLVLDFQSSLFEFTESLILLGVKQVENLKMAQRQIPLRLNSSLREYESWRRAARNLSSELIQADVALVKNRHSFTDLLVSEFRKELVLKKASALIALKPQTERPFQSTLERIVDAIVIDVTEEGDEDE